MTNVLVKKELNIYTLPVATRNNGDEYQLAKTEKAKNETDDFLQHDILVYVKSVNEEHDLKARIKMENGEINEVPIASSHLFGFDGTSRSRFNQLCKDIDNQLKIKEMYNKLLSAAVTEFEKAGCIPCLVDIRHSLENHPQLTMGDLHGNAIKLLFMLFYHDLASGIDEHQYAELVEIYKKPVDELEAEHLQRFKEIINKIQFKKEADIRLIGDVLADRGSNDYFTLLVLAALKKAGLNVNILASNHDMEFIYNFEEDIRKPSRFNIRREQSESMYRLATLIEENLISVEELNDMMSNSYFPDLKLLDYGLDNDKKAITIHSHAPTGLETIREIAGALGIKYLDSSVTAIAFTIENINAAFRATYIDKKRLTDLFRETSKCFFELLWRRGSVESRRPFQLTFGDRVDYVHGHDSNLDQYPDLGSHTHNLDNTLGKDIKYGDGLYTMICGQNQDRLTAKEISDYNIANDFSDKQEDDVYKIQRNKLKRLIPRIVNQKTGMAAYNLLQYIIYSKGDTQAVLIDVLEKANQLLESSVFERDTRLTQFQDLAKGMVGAENHVLHTLGILMMVLGAAIAAVAGVLLATATFGVAMSAGMGGLGLVTLLSGVGLFANSGAQGLARHISELAVHVSTEDEKLLSSL